MSFGEQERLEGQLLVFLRSECHFHPKSKVQHKVLHESFDKYRTCGGTYPELYVGRNTFSAAMRKVSQKVGVSYCRDAAGMFYKGLELKTEGPSPDEREATLREERVIRLKEYQAAYYQQHKHEINPAKTAKRSIYSKVQEGGLGKLGLETLRKYKLFEIVYKPGWTKDNVVWSQGNIEALLCHYIDMDATIQLNSLTYSRLQGESMLTTGEIEENQRQTSALFRSVMMSSVQPTQTKSLRLKVVPDKSVVVEIPPHLTETKPTLTIIPRESFNERIRKLAETHKNTAKTSPERTLTEEVYTDIKTVVVGK